MIKDNAHIELDLIKKQFISITKKFEKIRILNWNFILRNISSLHSDSFIYLFIDPVEKLLEIDNKPTLKKFTKNLLNKYNLNPIKTYKIKFLSEHKKPLLWYSNLITPENFEGRFGVGKNIEKEIQNLAKFLNYKFNIYELNIKTDDYGHAHELFFFIEEQYVSSEL